MEELLAAGYRKLAMENHPDHGGDTKAMQEINEAVARLRKKLT
jgi:curved DNA-binding protein CbpA